MFESYKVLSKFSSKAANGELLKFRIHNMPDDRFKEVSDLLRKYFIPEEAIFRASGVLESVNAVEEAKEFLLNLWNTLPLRIVVCCIDDGTENIHDIIGASLMAIKTKDDVFAKIQPQTIEMKKYIDIIFGLYSQFDVIKALELNTIYKDWGVVVHPKYRGLGITQEFFRIRRVMCKEHGIPITGAWMTSIGSQKAAKRDGWETVYEATYKDLGDQYAVTFQNAPPTYKYMIGRSE